MGTASEETFTHLEPIPARYGYALMLVSMAACLGLRRLVARYGPPESVPLERRWQWQNLCISWTHALLISLWDLSCFFLFPEMLKDLIGHFTFYSYAMIACSAGYFCYDFIDYILDGRFLKEWAVSLHHIVVGTVFIYNVTFCNCIGYTCFALLTEVNTFFLHSRKLLQISSYDLDHWLYRLSSLSAIVTFIFCRFGVHFYIIYGIVTFSDRLSTAFVVWLCVAMLVMVAVDSVLYFRLVRNDLLRPTTKVKHKDEDNEKHFINNNAADVNGLRRKTST